VSDDSGPPSTPADSALDGTWVDLCGRVLIRARGADRARFLNGMLSADVGKLAVGGFLPSLLLDRKGHVLSEGAVWARADELLLDLSPGTAAAVLEILEKHLVADDVTLQDDSASWAQRSFEGPAGRRWLGARGLPLPEPGRIEAAPGGVLLAGEGWLTREGVRALGPRQALAELTPAGLRELAGAELERARIEQFVPLYGRDISARSFPQEARLDRSVSYTKGCYLGQEIVARIHSRGAVNRLLVGLECAAAVDPGTEIRAGGSAVGAVTSAAARGRGGSVALGYVKRDLAQPGTELEVAGQPARVSGPPL
jgi:folate-binding protein YgfZ